MFFLQVLEDLGVEFLLLLGVGGFRLFIGVNHSDGNLKILRQLGQLVAHLIGFKGLEEEKEEEDINIDVGMEMIRMDG